MGVAVIGLDMMVVVCRCFGPKKVLARAHLLWCSDARTCSIYLSRAVLLLIFSFVSLFRVLE